MAQLIVRKLEESVKQRLRQRARRHGRSMEDEARDILRNAVKDEGTRPTGLGTRLKARFAKIGFKEPMEELPRRKAQPSTFRFKS